ncbi:MAG: glucosamine-6-phosphate deaminase [Lachnospiraceae bacterium]|nr:glucosamine-6-phosphate deaminase [Lachnospiraceae bacterium]
MRIYREKDYTALSRRAANLISAEIIRKPDSVLGLATGGTPVGTYSQLIEWNQKGDFSFAEVKTVNLDEYQGLLPEHPQSYRCFMQEKFFDHIDIKKENTFVPNGEAEDMEAECARYDELVRSLGYADLQLLGLGRNGHIGFNEPSDFFHKETHLVDLTESTIEANARFFGEGESVPRRAITMGVGCIMAARRIVMVVSGANKAEAVRDALLGAITPRCPASILQLHNDVVLVGDEEALAYV